MAKLWSRTKRIWYLFIVIIALEILFGFLVPTWRIGIPSETGNLPYKISFDDPSISIDLSINEFWNRKIVFKNDVVIFNFSIRNKMNQSIEVEHSYLLLEPIFFQYPNKSFILDKFETKNFEDRIYLKNEGLNIVNISFKSNNVTPIVNEFYIPVFDLQTETTMFFNKYGQILSMILIIPTAIIALKNLMEYLEK